MAACCIYLKVMHHDLPVTIMRSVFIFATLVIPHVHIMSAVNYTNIVSGTSDAKTILGIFTNGFQLSSRCLLLLKGYDGVLSMGLE